jgi:hypothetical protein
MATSFTAQTAHATGEYEAKLHARIAELNARHAIEAAALKSTHTEELKQTIAQEGQRADCAREQTEQLYKNEMAALGAAHASAVERMKAEHAEAMSKAISATEERCGSENTAALHEQLVGMKHALSQHNEETRRALDEAAASFADERAELEAAHARAIKPNSERSGRLLETSRTRSMLPPHGSKWNVSRCARRMRRSWKPRRLLTLRQSRRSPPELRVPNSSSRIARSVHTGR